MYTYTHLCILGHWSAWVYVYVGGGALCMCLGHTYVYACIQYVIHFQSKVAKASLGLLCAKNGEHMQD